MTHPSADPDEPGDDEGVSEFVSEKTRATAALKHRRGRPLLALEPGTDVEQEDGWWLTDDGGRPLTRRHVLNMSYAQRATTVLSRDKTVPGTRGTREVLVSRSFALEQFYKCYGVAVLAELGRHGSDEQICASADALLDAFGSEEVRTQTEALRWLRRRRLGPTPQTAHEKDDLESILYTTLYGYRQRYPDVPLQEIIDALDSLANGYRERLSREQQ